MKEMMSNKKTILILVLPGILLMLAGIIAPIILSVAYSLTDMHGGVPGQFIGLTNYIQLFTKDGEFWISILHAIILALCYILLQHPLCMLFAIMLDKIGGKGEKVFRVMLFIPCVISVMVTSKMWINILNPTFGMLAKLLKSIGLSAWVTDWLSNPNTVLPAIIFIVMWQGFGNGMLIYYAGYKGVSEELLEAASLDGATGLKRFFHVTLPQMMPVVKVNMTLAIISAFKQMETVYLITNGGPGNRSQFIANYLYSVAFKNTQYGYANAISVVFIVICMTVTLIYNGAVNRAEG